MINERTGTYGGMDIDRRNGSIRRKLFQCPLLIHYKFHTNLPGIEAGPPRLEACH
jgi:hypothetical protein